ncbi:MAG TPA: IS110 family transposase [Mucilaginibacter sp.]|nr:IS110 family transposase [Mucilaginibacter sp.]
MEQSQNIKNPRKKNYKWFIGIDVSKHTLDYTIIHKDQFLLHHRGKNEKQEILQFITEIKKNAKVRLGSTVFCMEAIGNYGEHLRFVVKKLKGEIAIVNPKIIKNFLGTTRGKDDKTDSMRIALYAQKNLNELYFWSPERAAISELRRLFVLRDRMLTTSVALNSPLREQRNFVHSSVYRQSTQLCARSLAAIQLDMENINACIDKVIAADQEINRLMTLMLSVVGIGRITALLILMTTNEFKNISNAKKFACYAGIAPFKNESGIIRKKTRVSDFANKKMKSLLHMCALSAIKCDYELKDYFERKSRDGKPKLVVINAIRYKLIARIFSCVGQNRLYERKIKKEELTAVELDCTQSL